MADGAKGFAAVDALQVADMELGKQGEVANEGHFVNLRETESLHAKVLKKVDDGAALTVQGHDKGWFAVTVDGISGFMKDNMVKIGPKPLSYKYIHANNGKVVNFRSAPEVKDDNVLAALKEGTELDVLIQGTDWDWVRAGGKLGFVSTAYTSDRNEAEQIPLSYNYGYVVLNNPTSVLHVRESADLSARTLHAYHVGTKMQILNMDDHFAEVQVGDVHGFVQSQYLKANKKYYDKPGKQPSYNSDGFVVATLVNPNGGDKINFRDNPSMHSNVISVQPEGVEAEVYSKGKDFSKVRLAGEWGYIRTDFLWFK
jgi:Bacterial SH3 domain.